MRQVTLMSTALTLADVNIVFFGAAASARLFLGLVDETGNFVHHAYFLLGSVRSGLTVPAHTMTFKSLDPSTKYAAKIFMDEVEGPTPPIVGKRDFARLCLQTGSWKGLV